MSRESLHRVRVYGEAALASRRAAGPAPGWYDILHSFGPWWRSFEAARELSGSDLPWLTFPAVDFLKRSLRPDWRVFEYGSGGSTIFFARRCREVISIEHDHAWAAKVQRAIDRLGLSNCRLQYVAPETTAGAAADHAGTYSSEYEGYERVGFEQYVRAIEAEADGSLDVVVIDGRARRACLAHAVKKVRPGGMLIVDNSERERYQSALARIPGNWRRIELPGPCAGTTFFTRTTAWIAPR